jgi:hypothetical protein
MKLDTKPMEVAARAVHENYFGKNTWKDATPAERGHARQAVRLTLSALSRTGVAVGTSSKAPPLRVPPPPTRAPQRVVR